MKLFKVKLFVFFVCRLQLFVEKLFTSAVKEADLEAVTMTDVQKKSLNIINQVPTTWGYTVCYE
jgi:hypothetical protein